jgi:hypothetical protein
MDLHTGAGLAPGDEGVMTRAVDSIEGSETFMRPRSRAACLVILMATIACGLASRRHGTMLPSFIERYAGDVLWATMVAWLLALLWPRAATGRLALGALAIAITVELTQLYRAPWLDAIRATPAGALALGQGFLWSDLACYAVGVSLAAFLDRWLLVRPGSGRRH